MPKLQQLRNQAFHAQRGLCCYCGLPKWQASPDELRPFGLRARTVAPLRCIAEHLIAQQDGGKDVAGNIAAACWLCNSRRHKRKTPPNLTHIGRSWDGSWQRGSGTRRRWPGYSGEPRHQVTHATQQHESKRQNVLSTCYDHCPSTLR